MRVNDQPGRGWTALLRRRPTRIVAGRREGGYTSAFEVICCGCGDNPGLDYRDVSPELQRIRGPYWPIAAGAAAYEEHLALHRDLSGTGTGDRPALDAASPGATAGARPPAGTAGRPAVSTAGQRPDRTAD